MDDCTSNLIIHEKCESSVLSSILIFEYSLNIPKLLY